MLYFILALIGIIIIEGLVIFILIMLLRRKGQKAIIEYNGKIEQREKNLSRIKKESEEIGNEIKNINNFNDAKSVADKLQHNEDHD